jgi:hypothetical protein
MPQPAPLGAEFRAGTLRAHAFVPKSLDKSKKQQLMVFCHQSIDADEDTRDVHVFREFIEYGGAKHTSSSLSI